jgi:simple sugar transport system permease protein
MKGRGALTSLAVVALALALVFLLVLALGYDAARVARAFVSGSVGSPEGIEATLKGMVPLLLCGLAVAIGFKAGVFNLGAEGQLVAGALAATAVAVHLDGPAAIVVPTVLVAGALGGAAFAAIAAWLKRSRGAPEVLSTILLNFVAIKLARYAIDYGNVLNERAHTYGQSDPVTRGAELAPFVLGGVEVQTGLLLAVVLALVLDFALFRTRAGLELRLTGTSPSVARATGFSPARATWVAFLVGGALAGAAGALGIMGVTHRLYGSVSEGAGYTAVAIALLARLRPSAVLASALLFAVLEAGAQAAQRQADVPRALAGGVEGLIVLAVLAQGAVATWLAARAARLEAAARAEVPA